MKRYVTSLALLAGSLSLCAQTDTIAIAKGDTLEMGTEYTVSLKQIKLKDGNSKPSVTVMRTYNGKFYGTTVHFEADRIYAFNGSDTTIVAKDLPDGLDMHDYTIIRYTIANLRLYRDGVWIGTMREAGMPTDVDYVALYGTDQLQSGFACAVVSQDKALLPNERAFETNTANMLSDNYANIAGDPFCNKGFTQTGANAASRTFYTNVAAYSGWGPSAYMDSENAYSGKYCVRLSGQAVYSAQGASLDQNISFTSGTPYLIRAMVKSDGYEGKLAIDGEANYLHITDTGGEWKQLEGVLTPSAARTNLYLNNADYTNNGTLYIDNVEVYKGYPSTSSISASTAYVPCVMLSATQTWSPANKTEVYMLGFTDNGTLHSQIDTAMVNVTGSTFLKKTVSGSQMYALSFPGELTGITVTGTYDGYTYADAPLTAGVDYVLQRYTYPTFNYLNADETPAQGCYIIQFVDNIDGLPVTLRFANGTSQTPDASTYQMVGNPYYTDYTPEGTFLKFDEAEQRFVRTNGESVKPFEAYIVTNETLPVYQIVPNGSTGILQQIATNDGTRLSVIAVNGGIMANAVAPCQLPIYNLGGQLVQMVSLSAGSTTIRLPKGIYVAGGKKCAVQ